METRASYNVSGNTELLLADSTLKRFTEGFEQPTSQEVRSLIRYLGWTGSEVAAFVGVNNRTVRKWQEVKVNRTASDIQYAAWRLLLLRAGLVQEI